MRVWNTIEGCRTSRDPCPSSKDSVMQWDIFSTTCARPCGSRTYLCSTTQFWVSRTPTQVCLFPSYMAVMVRFRCLLPYNQKWHFKKDNSWVTKCKMPRMHVGAVGHQSRWCIKHCDINMDIDLLCVNISRKEMITIDKMFWNNLRMLTVFVWYVISSTFTILQKYI